MEGDKELRGQREEREPLMEACDVILERMQELREDERRIEVAAGAEMVMVYGQLSWGHAVSPNPCGGGRRRRSLRRE